MRMSCLGGAGKGTTGTSIPCFSSKAFCSGCQGTPRAGGIAPAKSGSGTEASEPSICSGAGGSMRRASLPDFAGAMPPARGVPWHPLQKALLEKHGIEVPVVLFPAPPKQLVRIAAQVYNSEAQFARLAAALQVELQLA